MNRERKGIITFIGWIVLTVTRPISAQDPCLPENYLELDNVAKRSPSYDQDSTPLCDRYLVEDWYRAHHHVMSTSPPPLAKCGTLYPIWLQDPVPLDGENDTLVACEVGFSSNCARTYDIDVKNCSTFLVYKLKPAAGCNSAYCFENDNHCVNETVSNVHLAYHNIIWTQDTDENNFTLYAPYVNLKCSFNPASDSSLLYYIDWYVDNDTVIEGQTVDSSSLHNAVLSAADMTRNGKKINSWIHCVVGITKFRNTRPCHSKPSNLFYAGIEILNQTLTIGRNDDEDLWVRPTIPIVLHTLEKLDVNIHNTGSLDVHLSFPGNTEQRCRVVGSALNACKITIPSFTYDNRHLYNDPINWQKDYNLKIHNSDQMNYYMSSHKLVLRLQTNDVNGGGNVSQIYSEAAFHDVHINIVEDNVSWKGKRCSSYADPHQTTFDGYKYECQSTGCVSGKTYILYRNEKHLQEVQVRHGSCWGRPRCICAVAARAGQDVFNIDLCSGKQYINFPICNENALKVIKETDKIYKIIFPTGTFVKIYLYNYGSSLWYINVEVYPTVSDVEETKGLCGFLDNDRTNDLRRRDGTQDDPNSYSYNHPPDQFSLSWQLPDGSSEDLLSPTQSFDQLTSLSSTYLHKLCTCEGERTYCSYRQYAQCKTDIRGREYHCVLHSSSRRKRDLEFITRHRGQLRMRTEENRVKRQAYSEVDAYNICYNAFQQSTYYESCLQIPNFSNESLVDCINDVVMTGDQNLTQLHLDTALGQCQSYILLNKTVTTENPDVATTIVNLCPNNCSNRGVCSFGSCSCEYGFGGSDCSFDVLSPPTVTRLSGDGVCDKSSETCDDITLYGQYFFENMNTTCFMTRNEMDENNNVLAQTSYTVPLMERTLFEGYCRLQYGGSTSHYSSFDIYLSNDGTQSLTPYTVYTYQSTCQNFMNVSGNIAISLQSGYCFISGSCVQSGTFQSNETCWQCVPSLNTSNWSWECNKTEITITQSTSTSSVSSVPESASSNPTTSYPPLSSSLLTTTAESATSLGSTPSVVLTSTKTVSSLQSTSTVSSTTDRPKTTTGVPPTTLLTSAESSAPSQSTSSVLPTSSTQSSTSPQTPSTTSSTSTSSSTTLQSTSSVLTSSQPITPLPPTLTTIRSTQAVPSSPSSAKRKALSVEEKGLIGAIAGVAVVILVVVGYMVKKKCLTKKTDDQSPTLNNSIEEDVNIYPDNKAMASRDNFNTADLFQFESQADKYSRPPSATSMRGMPVTNDLRKIFDQQHLDKLFSAK